MANAGFKAMTRLLRAALLFGDALASIGLWIHIRSAVALSNRTKEETKPVREKEVDKWN